LDLVRGTAALSRPLIRPVLTIGNFDGIHVGHRTILETIIARARALAGESVLFTFEPHPRKVLVPDNPPRLLATLEQKLELIEQIGVDVVILEPFDREFARISPDVFVREYIHRRIRPLEVYVGYDFHFGRDREGSMRLLTETGPRLGFSVTIIPEVTVGSRDVNSTRIRDLLADGRVEEAAVLLGRPFGVRGAIVTGERRGRDLGFPTANLAAENEILPRPGVYAGEMRFLDDGQPARGTSFKAVTNIGTRPTFPDGRGLVAEAHLIGFSGDIYGRHVELSFHALLRAEQRFASPEALRAQIQRDVDEARRRLGAS